MHKSSQYFSNLYGSVIPGTLLPGYALLNFRYEWQGMFGSGVSLAAFVRNALDRQYYLGGFPVGATIGVNTALPGPPRQYGAEFNYKF
jgi:iron complex outermembrane receptor protein